MTKRLVKPDLDVGRTVQKMVDKIADHVSERTKEILKGDLAEGEYKDACGYIRAFSEVQQMLVDAFTYEAGEQDSASESQGASKNFRGMED